MKHLRTKKPAADNAARKCDQCGTSFMPVRAWQRFCRDLCRLHWFREREPSQEAE